MIKSIQKNMNKKGFTLVELIIVIAVMAILAAIVIPRMGGVTTAFKQRADERICDSYAREIEVMVQVGSQKWTADSSDLVNSLNGVTQADDPQSAPSSDFYYFWDHSEDTIYVYVGTGKITTAPTTGEFVSRDNVTEIK